MGKERRGKPIALFLAIDGVFDKLRARAAITPDRFRLGMDHPILRHAMPII
jgi:hypothetical protein